jgi:hypothetical protein
MHKVALNMLTALLVINQSLIITGVTVSGASQGLSERTMIYTYWQNIR